MPTKMTGSSGSIQRYRPWILGLLAIAVLWLISPSPVAYTKDNQRSGQNSAREHRRREPRRREGYRPPGGGHIGIRPGAPRPLPPEEEEQERIEEEPEEEDTQEESSDPPGGGIPPRDAYVVLGFNDLGMHCMNQDFSQLCILPPYNNLHAQVIRRGREPRIIRSGVTVRYQVPRNTTSVPKTNFWQFAPQLFGVNLEPDVGLTGNSLAGTMSPTGQNDWAATGIPITPIDDFGNLNPYPISEIQVESQGQVVAQTHAVVPVSWEISCNLCHARGLPNAMVDADILRKHDLLHNTNLLGGPPVLCAACHADPALGTAGLPGVKSLSAAMHGSHADRMGPVIAMGLGNICYSCHPGFQTNCQRDVHFAKGIFCMDCHGDMAAVGNTARTPWVDEPTCGSCHQARQPEFDFEEPGKLFKDSRGHGNVHCAACHGSPHAVGPAVTAPDNLQANELQGYAGPISNCVVCHTSPPGEHFEHERDD